MHATIIISCVLAIGAALSVLFAVTVKGWEQDRQRSRTRAEAYVIHEAARRKRFAEQQLRAEREYQEQMRLVEEALRKISGYQQRRPPVRNKGVVTRGDVRRARELLARYGGYKLAVKQTHPDYGGNAHDFDAVMQAKKLVDRFPHVI